MTERDAHVTIDELAAYAAGDLDSATSVAVEAHMLLCADCRADLDALAAASRDLAALAAAPVPVMPADVAARIDAALAAERTTEDLGDAAPVEPLGSVLPMRRRPSLAGLSAAAVTVALLVAVGVGVTRGGDGGSPMGTAAGELDHSRRESAQETRVLSTGLAYSHETVAAAVRDLVVDGVRDSTTYGGTTPFANAPSGAMDNGSARSGSGAPPRPATVVTEQLPRISDVALRACVLALQPSGPRVEPLLVDHGTYDDQPALVIVLPTLVGGEPTTDRVDVWVVGRGCGPRDAQVLNYQRVRL